MSWQRELGRGINSVQESAVSISRQQKQSGCQHLHLCSSAITVACPFQGQSCNARIHHSPTSCAIYDTFILIFTCCQYS